MQASEVQRALEAGRSTASALGLRVDDAIVVHNSNRIAVRLTPCDVLARVAPVAHEAGAEFEVEVGRRLAEAGSPVEALEPRVEPRVYVRDGFAVTLWTWYESVSSRDVPPAEYAEALERHHARLAASLLQGGLFDRRTEREAEMIPLAGAAEKVTALVTRIEGVLVQGSHHRPSGMSP